MMLIEICLISLHLLVYQPCFCIYQSSWLILCHHHVILILKYITFIVCHPNTRFSVHFSCLAVSTVPYAACLCSLLEVSEDFERKASDQKWKASKTYCCVTEGEEQAQEESDIQLFLSHFHYHQWWNTTNKWQFQCHRHKSKCDPSEAFIADGPEIVLI